MERFIAPSFWSDLTEAVAGLRDVLDDQDGMYPEAGRKEYSMNNTSNAISEMQLSSDAHTVLFSASISADPVILQRPALNMRTRLLNTYRERVDPVYKLLHWPTVYSLYTADDATTALSPGEQALEFAIYFTALCTLSDPEVSHREAMLEKYKLSTEAALSRAKLLISKDTTVLQALMTYLLGLRTCQNNASAWSLLALAVRLATAQGLDTPFAQTHGTLYQQETKRRLWCCIGLMDVKCSLDRGTPPLLAASHFHLPRNINDDEINARQLASWSGDAAPADEIRRWTDMTFPRMNFRAMVLFRQLAAPELSWIERSRLLSSFEEQIQSVAHLTPVSQSAFQNYALACLDGIVLSMQLLLRRPVLKTEIGPPPVDDKFDVLDTATRVLQRSSAKHMVPEFEQWSWYAWVPWFALAIVLAEICGRPAILASSSDRAEAEKIEHSWAVAKMAYEQYSQTVADGDSGLLWAPIVRLMTKAREIQDIRSKNKMTQSQPVSQGNGTIPWTERPDVQFRMGDSNGTHTVASSAWSGILAPQKPLCPFAVSLDVPQDEDMAFDEDLRKTANGGFSTNAEAMSWFNWEAFVEDIAMRSEIDV